MSENWTLEDYKKKLAELTKATVPLDKDPVAGGLTNINAKIASIQAQKDFVNQKLVEAIGNKSKHEIDYNTTKHDYDQKVDNLMMTDTEVKTAKSDTARRSVANTKLRQEVLNVHSKLLDLTRAESYMKCVYQMYNNLCSTQDNLSRQISVIQMGLQIKEITREDLFKVLPRNLHTKESEGKK